jgi:hypothetical protein
MLETRAKEYSIGEQVIYLRDKVEGRLWNITDIDGKFLTIELDTNFVGQSVSPLDPVQVVTVMDIAKRPTTPQMGIPQTTSPMGMTYAPVININTNSTPSVETSGTTPNMETPNTTQSTGNVLENPVANSTNEKNNEKSEEKSGGGMFDFSNFVIKKMGL